MSSIDPRRIVLGDWSRVVRDPSISSASVSWLPQSCSKLQLGKSDTIGDLVADGRAAAFGGALVVVWAAFGWGTVRRSPADRVEGR
jgi:hypothetical protein